MSVCDDETYCEHSGFCNETFGDCVCTPPWAGANCEGKKTTCTFRGPGLVVNKHVPSKMIPILIMVQGEVDFNYMIIIDSSKRFYSTSAHVKVKRIGFLFKWCK